MNRPVRLPDQRLRDGAFFVLGVAAAALLVGMLVVLL